MRIYKTEPVKKYTLFPDHPSDGEVQFNRYFIEEVPSNTRRNQFRLKNIDLLKRRFLGIFSYLKNVIDETFPETIMHKPVLVAMSDYQYQTYEIVRDREKQMEKSSASKSDDKFTQQEKKSSFSIYSRQICNFVFPEHINVRPNIMKKSKLNDLKEEVKKESNENANVPLSQKQKRITKKALALLHINASKYLNTHYIFIHLK